ncbi:amino acid permease [Qipengyuania flava]|uniref:Amino acid permease n=1 Tax=Qipengyuania flava TaxID=192812 RepID=A0A5P6NC99_9SPHN|nr:amino acid permease [Qipengyuania flava]
MTNGEVPLSDPQIADGQRDATGLVRSLTLTHTVLYGVGVTIGAGIYVLVGVAAGRSGMHAPLGFLLAAIAMGMTAASFAELGTRMPVSASEAAYVERAFHRRWLSLGMGLLVIITATISGATISSGSAGYVAVFLDLPPTAIIVGVVLLMGAVACLATTQSIAVAGLMTLVEVGGLLVIIGAGMTEGTADFTRLPEMIPSPSEGDAWMALGGTTLIAVFAFVGFEHIVNVAEEIKNPGRTLPRALFATLGITALLYGLVVWTAVTAVPPDELARSSAPLATVFEKITGRPPQFMSVIAIVATLNGIVVHMIMIARVLYGLSSQGSLPSPLSRVNQFTRTPLVATAAAVSAILLLAVLVPLEGLAEWAARGTLVIFAGINVALIKIKRAGEPAPEGVFTCPLSIVYAGFLLSVLLLVFDLLD